MFSVPTAPGADKTDLAPFGMVPESELEEGQDLRLYLFANLSPYLIQIGKVEAFSSVIICKTYIELVVIENSIIRHYKSGTTSITGE